MEPTDQTQESGVSERFSGNTRTKFPKNCVKMTTRAQPEVRRAQNRRVESGTRLSVIPPSESESRPYAATTTQAAMESAKARKRPVRRVCGLHYESSADPHSRRGGRSRGCGSHFAKWRAE